MEQTGTHTGSKIREVYTGQRRYGTGLIQGARSGKRGVGSVIIERLYIDIKHGVKKTIMLAVVCCLPADFKVTSQ